MELEKEKLTTLVNISSYARKYAELENVFLEEEGMSWLLSGIRLLARAGTYNAQLSRVEWILNYRGFATGNHFTIPTSVVLKCLENIKQQGFTVSDPVNNIVTISWNN
jgi:hypothetical protein